MAKGYIDSASLYEVVTLADLRHPGLAANWSWDTVVDVTLLLTGTHHVRMAPAPAVTSAPSDDYATLARSLGAIVDEDVPDNKSRTDALSKTLQAVDQDPAPIRSVIASLLEDKVNFARWLDWSIRRAWVEHATRLGSLFNVELIPALAVLLDLSESNLQRVRTASAEPSIVTRWVKIRKGEDFEIAKRAYVTAALLRGYYHDALAQSEKWQILHHPIRRFALRPDHAGPSTLHLVPDSHACLANILVGGALRGVTTRSRILRWAENVLLVRLALLGGKMSLPMFGDQERALRHAVAAARTVGVNVQTRWVEHLVANLGNLGIGVVTSFALTPFWGLVVGVGASAATSQTNLGRTIANRLTPRSEFRLLARAKPGRLRGIREPGAA